MTEGRFVSAGVTAGVTTVSIVGCWTGPEVVGRAGRALSDVEIGGSWEPELVVERDSDED